MKINFIYKSDFYFVLVHVYYVVGFPSSTGSIIYAILQVLIFNLKLLVLEKSDFCLPPNKLNRVFLILQIVITGVGAALIDKAGRKPLLLVNSNHKATYLQTVSDILIVICWFR